MTNAVEIQEELISRGYEEVRISCVTKNSVRLTALSIRKDKKQNIAPCIYVTKELCDFKNAKAACDVIEKRLSENCAPNIGDPDQLISRESILEKVTIGVQRASNQDLVKRPSKLDGIEQYLFIRGNNLDDSFWRIKLTPSLLKHANVGIDEVWCAAEANTFTESEITIQSMRNMISEMTGQEIDDISDAKLYVVTNRNKSDGAVQIFNRKAIKSWAEKHGYKQLVVLPSSLHEVIILPKDDNEINLEGLSEMVKDINMSQVNPVDQLSDRAYLIDIAS